MDDFLLYLDHRDAGPWSERPSLSFREKYLFAVHRETLPDGRSRAYWQVHWVWAVVAVVAAIAWRAA